MKPSARTAAAILRQRRSDTRTTRRAHRALATGTPQTARTHLTAAGIPTTDAHRFSAAFSRGITPTATTHTTIKLKGRTTKTVPVKLYDRAAFAGRLATYRPKDKTAAARFNAAAMRLAA